MNIIYVSTCCSQNKLTELSEKGYFKGIVCAQKYHLLMMQGLCENLDGDVLAVSAVPTNRQWTKKLLFKNSSEKDGKLSFFYSGFINYPILRQLSLYLNTLRIIKKYCKKYKDCVIVCDILNQSIATAARKAGEKCKVPVIGIVTDVPGACVGNVNKDSSRNPVSAFISKYSKESMLNYDGYLLLTKAMNELVNPHNKPYVVIEGHSDIGMSTSENLIENKSSPNVIMYAGGVSKVYGIEMLVNAFKKINPDNWELHIYGKGDYDKELSERSKTEDKIKFGGLLPNSEIVDKQIKAALLVNPRPTDKEYVKYSFPSKTLECMVSGTPLITTALPGMPKEYNDYVYIFDKETEDGFADTLKKVMSLDKEEIHSKGISAKEFALKEKNNVTQAKKFTEFLVDICIK